MFYLLLLFLAAAEVYEGEIQHYVADNFRASSSKTYHLLHLGESKEPLLLNFSNPELYHNIPSGSFIQISGNHQTKRTADGFDSFSVSSLTLIRPHREETTTKKRAAQPTDNRRAIAILVNFRDVSVECGAGQIKSLLWGDKSSVQTRYEFDSNGHVTFDVNPGEDYPVYGPVTIPVNLYLERECVSAPDRWAFFAEEEVKRIYKVDFNLYRHKIIIIPSSAVIHHTLCGWNGLGNMACGASCRTWISECDKQGVYLHELGHNLGLRHSGSNIALKGDVITYGDPIAIMGNMWWNDWDTQQFYFAAPQKLQLQWFPPESVLTVVTSGVYRLSFHNQAPSNRASESYLSIRIRRPDEGNSYYHFSYVSGPGVALADRCLIHVDYGLYYPTQFISSLGNTESFVDLTSQFTVTQLSVTDEVMLLDISFQCLHRPSILSLAASPSASYYISEHIYNPNTSSASLYLLDQTDSDPESNFDQPSSGFNVTFRITNQNNAICPVVSYSIVAADEEWKLECALDEILISPETSCTVECRVSPKYTITNTTEMLFSLVGDSALPSSHHNHSLMLQWNQNNCSTIPTLQFPSNLSLTKGKSIELEIELTNNDSPSCPESDWLVVLESSAFRWSVLGVTHTLVQPLKNRNWTLMLTHTSNETRQFDVFIIASSGGRSHNFTVGLSVFPECTKTVPSITTSTNQLDLSAKDSANVQILVQNNDSPFCPPTPFTFAWKSSFKGLAATFQPQDGFTLKGSTSRVVMLIFHLTTNVTSPHALVDATIATNETTLVSSFNLTLHAIPCTRNPVSLSHRCTQYIPTHDPNFKPEITCAVFFANGDTWPCPAIKLNLSIPQKQVEKYNIEYQFAYSTPEVVAGNWSWLDLKIKFLDWKKSWEPQTIPLHFIANDTENPNIASHQAYSPINIHLGPCLRSQFGFTLGSPQNATLVAGGSYSWRFDTTETINSFCPGRTPHQLSLAPSSIQDMKNKGYSHVISEAERKQNSAAFYLTVFASDKVEQEQLDIIVIADDKNETESTLKNITLGVSVTSSCWVTKPTIMSEPEKNAIEVGPSTQFKFDVNVTNTDNMSCPTSNIYVQLRYKALPIVPGGLTAGFIGESQNALILALEPNMTKVVPIQINTKQLLPPGRYAIQVETSDPAQPAHSHSIEIPITVQCPEPRPIWNFHLQPLTSSFGTSLGTILYWNACIVAAECCCPCKYEIQKNKKVLGLTTHLNYTDPTSLSEIGLQNEYEVTVIDFYGHRSSLNSCGNSESTVVESSSLDGVYVLLVIGTFLLFPFLLTIIERTRYRRCDADWDRYPAPGLHQFNEFLYRRIALPEYTESEDEYSNRLYSSSDEEKGDIVSDIH